MGIEAAKRLNFDIGDTFLLQASPKEWKLSEPLWEQTLKIVGLIDHPSNVQDNVILVNLETSWDYYRKVHSVGLLRDTQDNKAVTYLMVSLGADQIDPSERLLHRGSVAQVINTREEINRLRQISDRGMVVLGILCWGVILLAAFGLSVLMNTRYESLKPDLGLMRALGYEKFRIASWIFWEGLFIAIASVTVAFGIEAILINWIDVSALWEWKVSPAPWPHFWNYTVWASVLGASFLAVGIPMFRLYTTDIRDAMSGL